MLLIANLQFDTEEQKRTTHQQNKKSKELPF